MSGPKWRLYQDEVAQLFEDLGLNAVVDDQIAGVRGVHAVDVAVRSEKIGLPQLWIVECKLWKRKVNKEHVLALQAIVQDVGADRGLLLSETGFQSGAIRAAHASNVTLTSLADLRANSQDELTELGLIECHRELDRLKAEIDALGTTTIHTKTTRSVQFPAGVDAIRLYALAGVMEEGLRNSMLGRWPAPFGIDWDADTARMASDAASLLSGLQASLDEIRAQLPTPI